MSNYGEMVNRGCGTFVNFDEQFPDFPHYTVLLTPSIWYTISSLRKVKNAFSNFLPLNSIPDPGQVPV